MRHYTFLPNIPNQQPNNTTTQLLNNPTTQTVSDTDTGIYIASIPGGIKQPSIRSFHLYRVSATAPEHEVIGTYVPITSCYLQNNPHLLDYVLSGCDGDFSISGDNGMNGKAVNSDPFLQLNIE